MVRGREECFVVAYPWHYTWMLLRTKVLGTELAIWHENGFISVSNHGWCPDGSGTKMKSYEPVSQIVRPVSHFFGTKRTHSPISGLKGEALYLELLSFFVVSADRRLVRICTCEFVLY
jgi:hypothetical protein